MVKKIVLRLAVLSFSVLLLAACASGANSEEKMIDATAIPEAMESAPTEAMMEDEPTEAIMDETPTEAIMEAESTDSMMEGTPDAMGTGVPETGSMEEEAMMAPAWFGTAFTNVVNGESFKIEDFQGKVVLVETFAQWCSTCLRQQMEVVKLHEMLGMRDDLVTVGLDVDPNEDAEMLKIYLEKHGFDWHYAIAPAESIREIGSLYGQSFLNPPSAPMMIIDRKGEAHPLPFGVKSAEDLQEALKPFLNEGM